MAYQDADTKYLVDNNIPELVNDMMAKLLAAKPSNATEFLLDVLKAKCGGKKFTAEQNFPDFHKHFDDTYMKGKAHLLAKYLSKDLYCKLYPAITSYGMTIDRVIQTGVDNVGPQYVSGVIAGDEECFTTFASVLDPIIKERHGHDPAKDVQPHDLDPKNLKGGTQADMDPEGKYIKSVRIRTARGVSGLPLPPQCNRAERREVERVLVEAYNTLEGDLKGGYHPLYGNKSRSEAYITHDEEEVYRKAGMLFQEPDSPMMLSCIMGRDWPDARGIWHNADKTFLAWVNEEDHTRLISMASGGDMADVFSRFCRGVQEVEAAIVKMGYKFMNDPHRGYLACCPSNIGTGVRCGAMCDIPKLCSHPRFQELMKKLKLQARGAGGVDSAEAGSLRDISNSDRMGYTEVQLVQLGLNGIKKVIALEKKLEAGESIDAEIDGATFTDDPSLASKKTDCQPHAYTPTPPVCIKDAEKNFPDFHKHFDDNYMKGKTHLLAKYLTLDVYKALCQKNTTSGFSIDRVIQTGVDNVGPQYVSGVIAGDDECFTTYKEIFDPIIKERHGHDCTKDIQPHDLNPDGLKCATQADLDPTGKYIKSVRIRTARGVAGLPLPPQCNRAERREVERVLVEAYNSMTGDLKGAYHPLYGNKSRAEAYITHDEEEVYRGAGMLFQEPDSPMMLSCRMGRDWPDARGIWHNPDKTFLAWINEEDHTRLISMATGGNMADVFSRFCRGIQAAEAAVVSMGYKFMNDPNRGYLACCPSNIGTGVRCGAMCDLPKLCCHPRFQDLMKKLRLQARGSGGVDSAEAGTLRDISNSDRMGFTEVQLVQLAVNGIKKVLTMEKKLEDGGNVDAEIEGATWEDDSSLKKQC